jgi:hypothetical protein
MSEVASRLYANTASAQAAADALREAGYRAHELTILSPPSGKDTAARDSVYASARAAGVFKSRAATLADGVMNGRTAVVCRARFWDGVLTREILDDFNPVDKGDTSGSTSSSEAEAAPLSDMLGLRVLGGRGDFFSNLFGLPTLARSQRGKAGLAGSSGPYKPVIPMPTLSNSRGGYKPVIPMPMLSNSRGSYKPVIPMPTLSTSRGGYKPVIPMRMLTHSGRGGYAPVIPLPTLTDNDGN